MFPLWGSGCARASSGRDRVGRFRRQAQTPELPCNGLSAAGAVVRIHRHEAPRDRAVSCACRSVVGASARAYDRTARELRRRPIRGDLAHRGRGQPTSTVHHSGGVGGAGGRGGTGGGLGTGGGAVAPSTQRALAKQGPVGDATAALAAATAPRRARPAAHSGDARATSSGSGSFAGQGSPPSTSVLKALTGSTSGGGLGPLLPIVLIGSLLAAAVLTLVRRRRTS